MSEEERSSSNALNTAYAYNTRPGRHCRESRSGWHEKIDELLALDHCFLGYRYSDTGVLFRGVQPGLAATLDAGCWLPSLDSGPLGSLERELGVYLLSHDLSDALTIARLWECPDDAAVLVFLAAEFHSRWMQAAAATLGFAEPGVVFKYPFLVEALPIHAISTIIVPTQYGGTVDPRMVRAPVAVGTDRFLLERWILDLLQQRGLSPAQPLPTDRYPRRDSRGR